MVAIGRSALGSYNPSSATNAYNVAVGYDALTSTSTGTNNTAVGGLALRLNTTGQQNTAYGSLALDANITGNNNTAIGYNALTNYTSSNNTAVGWRAMNDTTTGSNQVAVGVYALQLNTTGGDNVAVGREALKSATTGGNNVAVGYQAGDAVTSGIRNTYIGNGVATAATTGGSNVAIGHGAGATYTTADNNTYVGADAGSAIQGDSEDNTMVGKGAGSNITTGAKNTIIGRYNGNQGGLDIRTSSNNIVLSDGDGNPRLHIDSTAALVTAGATPQGIGVVADANYTEVGRGYINICRDDSVTINTMSFGKNGTIVGSISTGGSATAYNTSSDYRLKENVVAMTGATDRLKQLNPSRFNFIADADTTVDGFLAHEVQTVVPEAITGTHNEVDDDGNPVYQGIDQSKLVPLLVATIQELEARIAALEAN